MNAFASNAWQLVVLAAFALVANASALVWGPNMLYLLDKRRPIARSIAYTVGRGLVLTVASVLIVSAVRAGGKNVDVLADQMTSAAKAAHPLLDVAIAAGLFVLAWRVWKHPPAFLSGTPPIPSGGTSGRLWPAFVLGVTILFANLLEFAWQILGLGGFSAANGRRDVLLVLAVIIWTVMGTATLWGPAIARLLAPSWASARFEKLVSRIPRLQPWELALPLAIGGALVLALSIWRAAH